MHKFNEGYTQSLIARGLTANSIAGYKRAVLDWLSWLDEREPTRVLAEEYLAHKGTGCGLQPTTIAYSVTAIRCYYEYVVDVDDTMPENPWRKVRKPKLPPRFPRVLTHAQVLDLIAQPMRSFLSSSSSVRAKRKARRRVTV